MVTIHFNRIQTITNLKKTVTNESNGSVGKELEKNVLGESNADYSHNEDTSMTGTVSNKLETNIMNKSSGDGWPRIRKNSYESK